MKRTLSIILSLVLVLTVILVGCSNKKEEDSINTSTPASETTTPATMTPQAENAKYDPPITLTTVSRVVAGQKYADGDSIDNNPWTRAYLEKYGIQVKTLWSVDAAQFDQKLNLTIASNDLPDFFPVNALQLKQLVESGQIADLTDAYTTATDQVKQMIEGNGPMSLKLATFDGKLMSIPWTGVPKEGANVLWVRTDWLKKLNLPEPKTMEDVLKISEAFTKNDPDGNNKDDTYGLGLDKDYSLLKGFLNGHHAYLDIWLPDQSGQLVNSLTMPEMKSALSKLQEMFKAGQIDPEFGTKDFAKVAESLTSGKLGMLYGSPYAGFYPLQTGIDKDPNMNWQAYPLASIDGDPAKYQIDIANINIGYWVVKKGVKNPEAILKMLDFWVSTFYENTSEDIYKQYVSSPENADIWQMNAIAAYRPFKNVDVTLKVSDSLKANNSDGLSPESKDMYTRIQAFQTGDRTKWAANSVFGPTGSMSVIDGYRKADLYINDEYLAAPTDGMSEKKPTLTKMMNEIIAEVISGRSSIEDYDKFVENWKKLGGDDITKEVNEWYVKNK